MNRGSAGVTVQEVGDRLVIRQGERHLTSYICLGIWKPYFYPLNGPSGNVVINGYAGGSSGPSRA